MPTSQNRPEDRLRELLDEQQKLTQLRSMIDVTCALLAQPQTSFLEACALMRQARAQALQLFPGKEETFELLYRSRFIRILSERMQFTPEFCN
ncbi:MAG: hypothetical protein AAB354_07390 [candidate division KSB1 bacterium]